MINRTILFLILLFGSACIIAQRDSISDKLNKGAIIGRIFANYYYGFGEGDKTSAFEVRRAYFGYKTHFNPVFSAEIKLDMGSPNDISEYSRIRQYAYFKTAALFYDKNKIYFKLGIFDLDNFDLQERFWNHRYVYKSFQDEHSFGAKADLGASFHYRFTSGISADITLMNGEGYTDLQRDNAFKTGLGFTVIPQRNWILRFYADYIKKEEIASTIVAFAGYTREPFAAGLEYNYKINRDYQKKHNQLGLSSYIMFQINEKFELFARYDRLQSNILPEEINPWNLADDGSAIITSLQYQPISHIKFALDYQDLVPICCKP